MRTQTMRAAVGLLALAPAALAFRAATSTMTIEPKSRIWIAGTSTMKAFTCEAPEFAARIVSGAPGAAAALADGEKAVKTATLEVAAGRMDCRNGTMNKHMTKALQTSEFPTITFVLSGYEPAKAPTGIAGPIDGQLTLGGVTKPVTFQATAVETDGVLHLKGAYDLKMTDFGIKPPTLMMGTMKVGKVVKVHFDLLVKG